MSPCAFCGPLSNTSLARRMRRQASTCSPSAAQSSADQGDPFRVRLRRLGYGVEVIATAETAIASHRSLMRRAEGGATCHELHETGAMQREGREEGFAADGLLPQSRPDGTSSVESFGVNPSLSEVGNVLRRVRDGEVPTPFPGRWIEPASNDERRVVLAVDDAIGEMQFDLLDGVVFVCVTGDLPESPLECGLRVAETPTGAGIIAAVLTQTEQ